MAVATTVAGIRTEQVVDQLRLGRVERPQDLRAVNGQYFDPQDQTVGDSAAAVHQGELEKANIEPLRELVDLIAIQRRYDAAQKALKEQSGMGQGFTDLLRGQA